MSLYLQSHMGASSTLLMLSHGLCLLLSCHTLVFLSHFHSLYISSSKAPFFRFTSLISNQKSHTFFLHSSLFLSLFSCISVYHLRFLSVSSSSSTPTRIETLFLWSASHGSRQSDLRGNVSSSGTVTPLLPRRLYGGSRR